MAIYKKSNSGYLPFVQKEQVTSPFTDIQNRAKVDASLKCIMGNERIHVNSLNKLSKEFGPNGEAVYEPDNGDSRIRFVGDWGVQFDSNGLYPLSSVIDDYIEITFYGTGLNLLHHYDVDDRDWSVSVDGGPYGSNIYSSSFASVINQRSYKMNAVSNLSSGLALGWHTVRLRINNAATDNLPMYGFEIINEASQITVKAGKAHGNGYEYDLASDQLIDYNLGFDNVLDVNVGTRGGRSIVYIDPSDGTVKKRLTKVDAASTFLGSTDHTNEVPYRIINFREFGRNRGDDFSTLAAGGSNRAFTLDDGITTLVGNSVNTVTAGNFEGIDISTSGDDLTLTFVGTGLDIISVHNNTGVEPNPPKVYVDGVLQGTLDANGQGAGTLIQDSICSGLPYGTHVVKIAQEGGNLTAWSRHYIDFTVYQSKKPELPEGAVEVADYNIMADFVAGTTAGLETIATGVLRKSQMRELIYSGTWSGPSINVTSINGFDISTNTASSYVEYTFYGTGFEMRFDAAAGASDSTVTVDGSSDLSGFTTSIYGGTATFNSLTGNIGGDAASGSGLEVSGLSLGEHTVRVTQNTNVFIFINSFDVITPIHSPHTTFGSRSIKDCRNFDSTKDVNEIIKEIIFTGKCNESNATVARTTNIAQILDTGTGAVQVYLEEPFKDDKFSVMHAINDNFDISGSLYKHAFILLSRNSAGAAVNAADISFFVSGVLEKDELKE